MCAGAESNGSVYFAVKAFNGHCGHVYGKVSAGRAGQLRRGRSAAQDGRLWGGSSD